MKLFHVLRKFGRKNTGQTLYEDYKKGFKEEPSPYLNDKNFFKDYEEVIESSDLSSSRGMLTICPTPIGNLRDISIRQYQALRNAEILACEDTRLTGLLLRLLNNLTFNEAASLQFPPSSLPESPELDEYTYCLTGDFMSHTVEMIKKTKEEKNRGIMISLNSYNQEQRAPKLIKAIKSGIRVVLVSDAGTPLISDPGYTFVKDAIKHGVVVESLPGPVAAITALTLSGFPTDNFFYQGYMPKTYSEKVQKLEKMKKSGCTSIVYESSHRILQTAETICDVYGSKHLVFIGQELTKLFERCYRGTAEEIVQQLKQEITEKGKIYGEISIVIAPFTIVKNKNSVEVDAIKVIETLNDYIEAKPRKIIKIAHFMTGWTENHLIKLMYKESEKIKDNFEVNIDDIEDSDDNAKNNRFE
ncbi:hypothetical protein SteCoe_3498 [Stentor coeruleus]|uniref:Tetrapyrrole methylase domain-containing protein n=1 Tax=Stentor coeruleus TaxID=5963 RepID=A0A1R2CWZ7_9CILI|nr:hypothetical protein SteCoe_3498 [Stentor coeruleus]